MRALASTVLTGAVQESTSIATPEPFQVDPGQLGAPAIVHSPVEAVIKSEPGQDGIAAKPEARTRGRPRKVEEEANAEKTVTKPGAGKRQKSLFDF